MEVVVGLTVGLVLFVVGWALGTGPMPALLLLLTSLITGASLRYLKQFLAK